MLGAGAVLATLVRRWRGRSAPEGPAPFEWPAGLTEAEAASRWRVDQVNETRLKPVRTWRNARRESVFTMFNLNLVGLALVQAFLAAWLSAGLTLLLLAFTTAVRIVQQHLADRRLAAFAAHTAHGCSVLRDGRVRTIEPDHVVIGDILVAGPGDQIVADGVLLGPGPVTVDTSALTGERGWQRVRPGSEVLAGTFVITGRAVHRADRVGKDRAVNTLLAGHAALAARPTRLEGVVAGILRLLLVVVLLYLVLLFATYLRIDVGERGQSLLDAAPVIFSLAPTGLYLMIIVAYAAGTAQIARRGALVQSARSVESLAETTVVCFTEVGILAGTSLVLHPFEAPGGGRFSESRLRQVLGDFAQSTAYPSAVARLFAETFDGDRRVVRAEAPHLATLGWSAVAFGERDAEGIYVVAPRRVLEGNLVEPLPAPVVDADGTPVESLVLAHRPEYAPLVGRDGEPRLPDGLAAMGEVRLRSQVQPDAMRVVRDFVRAGVTVKAFAVGSGDIALSVLRAGGMTESEEAQVREGGILSREDLEQVDPAQWGSIAARNNLYGGLTPLQVGALVRALRERGEVVTVVGDGVADLPALTEANVAVSQPASTQAALGLADVALLDNDPRVLLTVFRRGQSIVRGLLDVMRLNLTMVVCTALLIGYVRLLGVGFPYVSGQGSLIGIVTGTIPSLAMGLWAPHGTVLRAGYARLLAFFVIPAGVTLSLVGLGVYLYVVDGAGRSAYAQLVVAYLLVYAGLLLNIVIRRTRVIAVLSAVLAVVVVLLPLSPDARTQFRVDWLEPRDYLVVALAVLVWIAVTMLLWRMLPGLEEFSSVRPGRGSSAGASHPSATRSPAPGHPLEPGRAAARRPSRSPGAPRS